MSAVVRLQMQIKVAVTEALQKLAAGYTDQAPRTAADQWTSKRRLQLSHWLLFN